MLGGKVYNDAGEAVGKFGELILSNGVVCYAIVGVRGFFGLVAHEVAVPARKFKRVEGRIVLPGASKKGLRATAGFDYSRMARPTTKASTS